MQKELVDGSCEHCGKDYKKQPRLEKEYVACPNCGEKSFNYSEESLYANQEEK